MLTFDNLLLSDCYVAVRGRENVVKSLEDLDYNNSCRAGNQEPLFSEAVFDEIHPRDLSFHSNEVCAKQRNELAISSSQNCHGHLNLYNFDMQEWTRLKSRLPLSLVDNSVKIPLNMHLDDASMVSSKMWKSGSVVGLQVRNYIIWMGSWDITCLD